MKETIHYLLMASHLLFQKELLVTMKATDLTPGQPKILEYLLFHDGAIQKAIADACYIEPATITSILLGMENKGLVVRKKEGGNRRNLYVYLTDKGRMFAKQVKAQLEKIEEKALQGLGQAEKEMLLEYLIKIHRNMHEKGEL